MSTVGNISKLQTLFEYLDTLTQRADQTQLETKLNELDITVDDLAEYVHFENEQYCRNLIKKSEHYYALLLCWRSGHRTPIHNHPNAVCVPPRFELMGIAAYDRPFPDYPHLELDESEIAVCFQDSDGPVHLVNAETVEYETTGC